jgi:hypothetical protein
MHDRIILLWGKICPYETSLTTPLFIEMHVQTRKTSGHVYVC